VSAEFIDDLLKQMLARKGSDLHLFSGDPPRIRQYGDLMTLDAPRLKADALKEMLYAIMPSRARQRFEAEEGADFAHAIPDLARFRVNVLRHLGGIGAVFRGIPSQALTIEQLALPDIVRNLCREKQGLLLVTGKTGSGKSTTLAAMLDAINSEMKGHIITIEDPIEFTHQRKQCLISQREVGAHTQSFAHALHSALREDPDVVLVGEMRDYETMSIAVTAAETGIMVMGTLHTNGAGSTVDRVVNTFPADKQSHIRSMLSTSLRGVISQQLVKRTNGAGRVAALEILVNTPAVANLIRQGKLDQLENVMQSGAAMGMQTMDGALKKLLEQRVIGGRDAYEKSFNKASFAQFAQAG
jgi:twitching motility protein PilT